MTNGVVIYLFCCATQLHDGSRNHRDDAQEHRQQSRIVGHLGGQPRGGQQGSLGSVAISPGTSRQNDRAGSARVGRLHRRSRDRLGGAVVQAEVDHHAMLMMVDAALVAEVMETLQVLQRQAYGYRNFKNYRLRVRVMCS